MELNKEGSNNEESVSTGNVISDNSDQIENESEHIDINIEEVNNEDSLNPSKSDSTDEPSQLLAHNNRATDPPMLLESESLVTSEVIRTAEPPPAIQYAEYIQENDNICRSNDQSKDISGDADVDDEKANVEVFLNSEDSDSTMKPSQPSLNNDATNSPNVLEPGILYQIAETPTAIPYDGDLTGMNPVDVLRRRAMPGSPELREYLERLYEYNRETVATNLRFIDQMQRQSEAALNSFMENMQREEMLRQQRIEAATMMFVFYIPPIWKRLVAEMIDFFILLLIKLIVTFLILDTFSIISNMSRMHIAQWIENPHLAAKLSTELTLLEIPFRVIVIMYETFFSMRYAGTPGKRWMGLRVLHVRDLNIVDGDILRRPLAPAQPPRICVRVNPATILPFRFALMRSLLKNAFVGLLMSPVCFSFIFVNQNRTGYDVVTNSMVVEFKPNTNQDGPIWN